MATITQDKKAKPGSKAAEDEAPKKGKRTLVVIIAAVVLVALGGGGAYFFLRDPGTPPPPEGGAMVQMDAMTVSLADGHYLKVEVAVQLIKGKGSADSFGTVKASQDVIDTFSNRDISELADNDNRQKITAQLKKDIQKDYPDTVFDIYLTQFTLQ